MKKNLYLYLLLVSVTSLAQANYPCDSIVQDLQTMPFIHWNNNLEMKYPLAKIQKGFTVLDESSSVAVQEVFEKNELGVFGPYDNGDSTISFIKIFKSGVDTLLNMNYIWLHRGIGVSKVTDSLLQVIRKGGSFADVAFEYSLDPSKYEGGQFGWFAKGSVVSIIEQKIQEHQKGDFFSVETKEYGWYIIEVVELADKRKFIEYLEIKVPKCP